MDTTHQDDTTLMDEEIDFDFFDVDETEARADETKAPKKPRSYRPRRLGGNPNWNRIAIAIAIGVVAVFVIYLATNAWLDHRRSSAFENYFDDVAAVSQASAAQGQELQNLLQQPAGADRTKVIDRLDKLVDESAASIDLASDIDSPGQLRETHPWLVTTMQYRHNGLEDFRTAFLAALDQKNTNKGAKSVTEANWRLLSSDVIYADSYVSNAQKVMKREGISGVAVPVSIYVTNDPEFGSVENAKLMLERFKAATPAKNGSKKNGPVTGLHGTELTSVTLEPAGVDLQGGTTAEVDGSTDLAFKVAITNGGDGQEVQIPVKIDIRGAASEPQTLEGVIDVVDPDETASVEIPVDDIPPFGEVLTVKVTVDAVPGEKNTDNNAATYQVMFSL